MKSKLAVKMIVAVLASIAHSAWAQDCSLSTLNGDYLMTGSAIPFEGSPPARTLVGVVMFDGKGAFSARETASASGVITQTAYDGTYTLEADCTGTVATTTTLWDLVLTRDGGEAVMIRTDPGTMATRTIKKR